VTSGGDVGFEVKALSPADYRTAFDMDEDIKERSREIVRMQVKAAEGAACEAYSKRVERRNLEALRLSCDRQLALRKLVDSATPL
jgi:stress response protein YsnF